MIKQLQRRFIKIAMRSFCIVVFLIVGLTNLMNYLRARQEIEENLSVVLENLDVIQQTEKNWKWSYGRKSGDSLLSSHITSTLHLHSRASLREERT